MCWTNKPAAGVRRPAAGCESRNNPIAESFVGQVVSLRACRLIGMADMQDAYTNVGREPCLGKGSVSMLQYQ